MKTYKIILITIAVFFSITVYSQTIDPPTSFDVVLEVLPTDNTMNVGDTLFKGNTLLSCRAIIVLTDTIGVKKIKLKLGSSDGASNYKIKSFNYTETGTFTDGTSMERVKNVVYINFGNYSGLNEIYSEVQLEDMNGALTPVIKFNNVN